MIDVSRYEASSKTLVGELMPFFLRGKKLMQFMSAICSPLDSVNKAYRSWCRNTLIEAATTAQIITLKWSMKERLKQYFANENDGFQFTTNGRSDYTTVYESQSEQILHTEAVNIYMPEDTSDDSVTTEENKVIIRDKEEISSEDTDLIIVAPAHNDNIDDDTYIKKIKQCFEPYLAYDMEYKIVISKS